MNSNDKGATIVGVATLVTLIVGVLLVWYGIVVTGRPARVAALEARTAITTLCLERAESDFVTALCLRQIDRTYDFLD